MATIEDKPETNISSEAYDLLDCFVGGLDKVVYEMAAEIARARSPKGTVAGPVQIEEEDVHQAGEHLLNALRELVTKGAVQPELAAIISNVEQCFTWRRQKAH
jgi:hypothetical protein